MLLPLAAELGVKLKVIEVPARAAGALDPRGGGLRARSGRPAEGRARRPGSLQEDHGRRGRGPLRRGAPDAGATSRWTRRGSPPPGSPSMEVTQRRLHGGPRRAARPGPHAARARERPHHSSRCRKAARTDFAALSSLQIQNRQGTLIPLSQLVTPVTTEIPQEIYHKNLQRVVYAVADVAGAIESPAYAMFKLNKAMDELALPDGTTGLKRLYTAVPAPHRHLQHEVGRRVADHLRGLPRPGRGLRPRARPHVHPHRGLVQELPHAPGHHGAHPALARGHHPRPRPHGRVLHGHLHDRVHRAGRHRGAQLDPRRSTSPR